MRRLALLLSLALLCLAFAPAPLLKKGRPVAGDPALYGEWQRPLGRDVERMILSPPRMTLPNHPGYEYDLRLDTSANPRRYDLVGVRGGPAEGRVFEGIYKVEGNTLTTRFGTKGHRPPSFDGEHIWSVTEVFTRAR